MTTINVPVISKAKGPKAGTSTSSVSNKSKKSSCKCVKTKCLKLYCECFQKGVLCNPECRCKDCSNTKENGVKLKATKKAYLTRNPNTFVKKPKGASPSCACRSNRYVNHMIFFYHFGETFVLSLF